MNMLIFLKQISLGLYYLGKLSNSTPGMKWKLIKILYLLKSLKVLNPWGFYVVFFEYSVSEFFPFSSHRKLVQGYENSNTV